MKVILPPSYFGPCSYYAFLLDHECSIEVNGSYIRQSIRNRSIILGANGPLILTVPVEKGKKQHSPIQDVRISYAVDWQTLHWRSIEAAYRSSPYFEYFEDRIKPVYEHKEKYLIDLDLKTIDIVSDLIKLKFNYNKTEAFVKEPSESLDLRGFPDHLVKKGFPEYTQVFSTKLPFAPDLSILDLILNEGRATKEVLEQIDLESKEK